MSLPLPDFGLTSWIDFTNTSEVTADAQLRISAVGDSLGLINDFTQATDANKPLLSRSDNRENLSQWSHDFTKATWIKNGINVVGSTFTATSGTSAKQIYTTNDSNMPAIQGIRYRIFFKIKKGTHNFVQFHFWNAAFGAGPFANYDLHNGVIGTRSANVDSGIYPDGDAFIIWAECTAVATHASTGIIFYMVPSASAAGAAQLAGTGTETVVVSYGGIQFASSIISDLITTDHPQYAGINGRPALVFNGAQRLDAAVDYLNLFSAAGRNLYCVAQPFTGNSGANQNLLFDTGTGSWLRFDTGGNVQNRNYVTSTFINVVQAVAPATSLRIIRARLSSGSLYVGQDFGAGYTETSTLSGDTTTTSGTTFRLGNSVGLTEGFYGKILGIATANTGAAKPNLENLLREYFFARSQLRWDPYLAELVLKRQ